MREAADDAHLDTVLGMIEHARVQSRRCEDRQRVMTEPADDGRESLAWTHAERGRVESHAQSSDSRRLPDPKRNTVGTKCQFHFADMW